MVLKIVFLFLLAGCATMARDFNAMYPYQTYSSTQAERAMPNSIKNRQLRTHRQSVIKERPSSYPLPNPFYEFNKKLFDIIGPVLSHTNMVYSPLSLQTLLSFIYTGAENETAKELHTALEIPELPGEVARIFQKLLHQIKRQPSQDMKLVMANVFYYNNHLKLNEDFYKSSIPYFDATVESTNFEVPTHAAARINRMIADITGQRISNLITSDTLDSNTQAILVNAIYLKAKWAIEFSTLDTQLEQFYASKSRTVPVSMMYLDSELNVGELPDLDAKAIDLPFKNSNLSMLIILPNQIDGLSNLERALSSKDLQTLNGLLLVKSQVILRMPKFKFEFEIDMTRPLMKLGASRVFTDNAELGGFFNDQRVRVDKIQHKAYISVNEGGVEAAAASFGKLLPLSLPVRLNYFTIDHPFVFVIRDSQAVYFVGHVVDPLP